MFDSAYRTEFAKADPLDKLARELVPLTKGVDVLLELLLGKRLAFGHLHNTRIWAAAS